MTSEVGKYLSNSTWITAERMFSLAVSFLVTILVARYLGPSDFGMLAYAVSLAGIFSIAGHVGLSGLVIRDLVRYPGARSETIGTAVVLKLTGYIFGLVALILVSMFVDGHGSTQFLLVLIVGASLFFKAAEVFDLWFQSQVQARYASIARMSAHGSAAILKVVIVIAGGTVFVLAMAEVIQALLIALLLVLAFAAKADLRLGSLRVSASRVRELLSQGSLVFLGALFAGIYLHVDQVMIRWLVGPEEVGVYAVAARLSEGWYFVPAAIVSSFFPRLIELRANEQRYRQRLQQLLDGLFSIALVVALGVTLFSGPLVKLIFGPDYAAAGPILAVHIWTAVFIFMRAVISKWILIENLLVLSVVTQGCGALLNVLLNWMLIPALGGFGAAVATLFSYAVASYFSLLFDSRSRGMFLMMSKAMLAPVRYIHLSASRAKARAK